MMYTIRSLVSVVLAAGSSLLFGCQSARITPADRYADTLTHAGIIRDLERGNYAGSMTVSNLLVYGDHGLGTFTGLDGEMILLDGTVYRADADHAAAPVSPETETPYAVVTYFQPDRMFDVERMDQNLFKRALTMKRADGPIPQAIQVHGVFDHLLIRSEPLQDQPWRPLKEVLATDERRAELTNVTGVLVGYYYPEDLAALHPAGYHLHFISEDRKTGGHVLDFSIATARISLDASSCLQVFLQTNQPVGTALLPVTRPVR